MVNNVANLRLVLPQPTNSAEPAAAPAGIAGAPPGKAMPVGGSPMPPGSGSGEVDQAELAEAVSRISEFVQTVQRDLSFSIDDQTGRTVIKVIDSATKELVRQIPSEEVLAIAQSLEDMTGVLFQAEA